MPATTKRKARPKQLLGGHSVQTPGRTMADIFVTTIQKSVVQKLKDDLPTQGFDFAKPLHTIFQAKKSGVTCTLYESLKLTVQGKNMREFLEFYLEPEVLLSPEYTYREELAMESLDTRARIGVDEAGKGDYFGPLCVAGVMADETTFPILMKIGVRDSKTLSDEQVKKMAKEIVSSVPNYIIRLRPKKYNELYASFKNLNSLLAWGHATVIEHLAAHTKAPLAIIDKFAHETVVERALKKKNTSIQLEQRVRGEADIVVAAASIIARWAFLEGLAETGKHLNVLLPKGAARHVVDMARRLARKHGKEILDDIAKLHFKITKELGI
jgi:ribonuclease HIII